MTNMKTGCFSFDAIGGSNELFSMTNRQRQIIEILLDRKQEITISDIAYQLQVSPRTVHRSLNEIEEWLQQFDIRLSKKSGKGIKLITDNVDELPDLLKILASMETTAHTSFERMLLLLCKLLNLSEPVKLYYLSHELQSAIPTISQDLDHIEIWLERHRLKLVRRRGYGVELQGTEYAKRRTIAWLAQYYLDPSALFGSGQENYADPVSRQLTAMIGRENFLRLETILWHLDDDDLTLLTEADYTNLLILLSVSINRYEQGFTVEHETDPSMGEWQWVEDHERLQLAIKVAQQLQLELPLYELRYIEHVLRNRKKSGTSELATGQDDLQLLHFVNQLIQYMSNKLSYSFDQDNALREGLLEHVQHAYPRLHDDEPLRDPLFVQVRLNYEAIYHHVEAALREFTGKSTISEKEAVQLVMHFGASLERLRQSSLRARALLVCTSGIGSSKLLAARIQKEFPQIDVLGNISWYEAARMPEDQYDVLISTVDLPVPTERYIKLSPLLTHDETEKLRSYIQERVRTKYRQTELINTNKRSALDRIGQLAGWSKNFLNIIQALRLFTINEFNEFKNTDGSQHNQRDLKWIVEQMCANLQHARMLVHSSETVTRLMEPDKNRCLIIPDSGVAFFHTRTPDTVQPIFTLFRIKQPIDATSISLQSQSARRQRTVVVSAIHDQQIRFTLLMLAPEQADPAMLEVLSECSALLLQEEFIAEIEQGDVEQVRQLLSDKFTQRLRDKLYEE